MKLLLDVQHSPAAAERLREIGFDVIAAASNPDLRELSDEELLEAATVGQRALVTENVKDFDRIVRRWSATDRHHAGVIFTSPRRFPRSTKSYPGNLITALQAVLERPPSLSPDGIHWL